jgi:hypothetical protein
LERALATAEEIAHNDEDQEDFADAPAGVLKLMDPFDPYQLWSRLRNILAHLNRPALLIILSSLVSLKNHLGRKSVLDETIQAIIDVSK